MNPSIGRIVHVRIGGTDEDPILRPAIIVRLWSGTTVNAQVFLDGTNDSRHVADLANVDDPLWWATSISEGTGVGYWRWPAR